LSAWGGKPYRFNPDFDALGPRPFLPSGEIIKHRGGALILRCPECNAMQFIATEIQGENEAPTITTPIKCACVRCDCEFRIRSGKAIPV